MQKYTSHIPFLESITDFFEVYGIGKPLQAEVMCMRLEDQPDSRLMEMPLYRSNFYRVILFTKATIQFTAHETKLLVPENCLVFSFPGKLESWIRSGRLHGYVCYFSASFLGIDSTSPNFLTKYPYFGFESEPHVQLTDEQQNQLIPILEEMMAEITSDAADKLEAFKHNLTLYLFKIRRIYNQQVADLSPDTKQSRVIYFQFIKKLDEYVQQLATQQKTVMPSVSLLAEQMNINANYLNGIIKGVTGKTASSYIQDKMILETKSYLLHTSLQVAEIAYLLGFENLPYFNRFFKKHTERTPLEFRKQFLGKSGGSLT